MKPRFGRIDFPGKSRAFCRSNLELLLEKVSLHSQCIDQLRGVEPHRCAIWIFEWMSIPSSGYCGWLLQDEQMRIRQELAGENPSPLEVLLIEQITLSILTVNIIQGKLFCKSGFKSTESELLSNHLDKAHRRMQTSIRTLAQIRRLGISTPAVQVNVTQQNLNVSKPNDQEQNVNCETKLDLSPK